MNRTLAAMALAAFALAATGEDFTWTGGSTVRSYTDTTYWSSSTPGALPGENDYFLHGSGNYRFDLGGITHTIGGVAKGYDSPYTAQNMSVENGTLVIKHSFSNRVFKVTVKNTGHFMLGPDSSSELGDGGGGCNYFYVKNGGELTMEGATIAARFVVNVESGGTMTFDPSSFFFLPNTYDIAVQAITNAGTAYVPSGVTLTGTGNKNKSPSNFTLYQKAGTMTLGGPVVRDGEHGRFHFVLAGGTLAATADVWFEDLYSCSMLDNATATVDVSMAKTLDFTGMSFGSGTTIEKTGRGTIMFGRTVPGAVSVQAGMVSFSDAATLGSLSLDPWTAVVFAHSGVTITSATGYADADFIVEDGVLGPGVPLLTSPDASFLAAVAAKLDLPDGYVAQVVDNTVTILQDEASLNVFTSDGEVPLDILENWNQEAVPEGEDVIVSGSSTIAIFDQYVPDFNSITVVNGATLKVYGAPDNLPPITLQYDAHLVFAPESSVTMPPIAGCATAAMLPTVEIATNATVVVTDDTYRMTNVHLRLFGTLDVKQDFDFGWADAGSTTFFNLTADGATITNRTNAGYLRFLCPETGGTVIAPSKMVFRHTVFRPIRAEPSRFRSWVGYGNPVDAPFTLEVDDCFFELRGNAAMYIGGAATIACVNGGGVKKTEQFGHPGLYMNLYIQDRAKLTFDDESYFLYTFNRYPIHVEPAEDGYETFVFRGNSRIGVHMLTGNGKAIATFENSWWDVLQLSDFSSGVVTGATDSRGWMTNAFHGLKVVNVPSGKFVGVRSEDYWPWGIDWNREILLDPDVPIIGGGSLFVTNASPGWSMRAIVACGANTATGEARAYPSADGCQLLFADGANWAGTVVGDENVAFTNRTSGAAPASVAFGAIRFAGNLPVRVWRTGANPASDYLRINGALSGTGGFVPVTMDGAPEPGDTYTIGEIPLVGGSAPDVSAYSVRGWKLSAVPSGNGETALLRIRCAPDGTQLFFR